MNTPKGGKLENANKVNNIQTTDARIVNDQGSVVTKASRLSICLKPEDDFPHPRHLCFAYLFGKSSPKKHCIKCYCYVCEEIAPCIMWNTRRRHCDATEKDAKWRSEKQLIRKKLPHSCTMAHHTLTIVAHYDVPDQPHHLYGGGLICNSSDEWVLGISMRLHDYVDTHDCSVALYIILLEGLKLAWSKGFRCLKIKLGHLFHSGFWYDFTRDVVTKKFHVRVDQLSKLANLKLMEEYLNREWFIDVKNTEFPKEEVDALAVSTMAEIEELDKKVYDFRTHPKTKVLMKEARQTLSLLPYNKYSDYL